MSKTNQTIVLTAVLLVTITATAFYIHEIDPETAQNRLLFKIKQELGTPETATFLGVKQYELVNTSITVYTWRHNNTLYEAQLSVENTILETSVYQYNDTMISMTPALAETLAEQLLITETEYHPGSRYLSEPTFRLFKFDDRGPRWIVEWGLHSGNYMISNVGFTVYVYTETGNTKLVINDFDEITNIPDFEPPTISEEEATQLAVKYYNESMNYAVIESTRNNGLRISSPEDAFMGEPFRLHWSISVSGKGQVNGAPKSRRPAFRIDAYTGELISSIYIGWWDEINWKRNDYPYYGSMYPRIIYNTPHDYTSPLSMKKMRSILAETVYQSGFSLNDTFVIRVYNETKLANDFAWDNIIVERVDGKPVIAAYWANAYDWVKTGTVLPIEDIQGFLDSEDILEGFFVVLDPETREILNQYNNTNIGTPSNRLNITWEQAINITATSHLADPEGKIISADALVSAEPRIIKPDWVKQLAYSGSIRRLYITDVNQTASRIYWVIRYEKSQEVHGGFTGTYLVDAETGALSLALEDYPLVQMLMRGSAPDQVKANVSSVATFNVNVTAAETLEAQLPVSIKAELVPENVTVIIENSVKQLSGEKQAVFNITAIVGELAEPGSYNIRFEISFPGRSTSTYTNLEITKPIRDILVEPRKQVFSLGETITFDIDSPTQHIGAYIRINNPENYTVWVTDPFTDWNLIDENWRVPYFCQLSEGTPMTLAEDALTGNWTWIYRDQNTTIKGGFTVKEPQDGPFSEVTEMSRPPTIHEDITNLVLLAEKAVTSSQEPVQLEDETGPGPAVVREDIESSSMWVPFITIVVVFGIVILKKNSSK